jgi:hypothetical protein
MSQNGFYLPTPKLFNILATPENAAHSKKKKA